MKTSAGGNRVHRASEHLIQGRLLNKQVTFFCFRLVAIVVLCGGTIDCGLMGERRRPLLLEGTLKRDDNKDDSKSEVERWWEREVASFESLEEDKEPEPLDRMIERAKLLYKDASVARGLGDYQKSEFLLKESLAAYPFLIESNLLLGKIFLIRGTADWDYILINQARLMFELARVLDPASSEPQIFLELVSSVPK